MKRINLLLSKRNIVQSLAALSIIALGIPLFLYLLLSLVGEPPDGIFRTQIPVYLAIGLFIMFLCSRYTPLYLEYDDEKIVAHYFPGVKATVWKNKTIYTGKLHLGKAGYQLLYSNEPFAVTPAPFNDSIGPNNTLSAKKLNRRTQITLSLTESEAIALFPQEMCLATEKADWSVLTELHSSRPAARSLTRKLRLVSGYWKELAALAFFALYVAGMTLLTALSGDSAAVLALYLIVYLSFPWIVLMVFTRNIAKSFRFCAAVWLGEHTVETHFFGKTLCTVDLNEKVYYAVFRGREYGTNNTPYIVVSNAWFNYYRVNEPNRSYLSEYPMDTQVVFPYNADTAAVCDFDSWHCVGGFGELNMHRSKTAAGASTRPTGEQIPS